MAPPDLLASDVERADAVEQLSLHCSRGRLTLEEFEWRVAEAYAARTLGQLDALLADLPPSGTSGAAAKAEAVSAGLPGLRPFTVRTQLDASPRKVEAAALETIAPALNRYDYELRQRSPATLVFERRGRPGWVPFVAVFTFPVGLVALAVYETQRIVISIDELGSRGRSRSGGA
jgi:uncharacterized protein DUF1707